MIKTLNYTGSKFGNGVYQSIINEFPPHKRYIELFGGSAAILKCKVPAAENYIIEINKKTIAKCNYPSGTIVINNCVFRESKLILSASADTLIYADPPYVKSSRRSTADIYDFEISDKEHSQLSQLLHKTKAAVAISGYKCELYNMLYKDWRSIDIKTTTHRGASIETVWFNYKAPVVIHETTYVGKNRTERQQWKRMANRWQNKFQNLPKRVQQLIMASLQQHK